MDAPTPAQPPASPLFSSSFQAEIDRYVVLLAKGFTIEHWPGIEKLSREQLAEGRIHWIVDLCELPLLSSRLMGQCIGLNAVLGLRGGELELRVKHGSSVASALHKARLSRIMAITEV